MTTINALKVCISELHMMSTIDWYRDALGFQVIQQIKLPRLGAEVAFIQKHQMEFELVMLDHVEGDVRPPPPIGHVRRQGLAQVSFRVQC